MDVLKDRSDLIGMRYAGSASPDPDSALDQDDLDAVPSRDRTDASLLDQMAAARAVANSLGLYDASDIVSDWLDRNPGGNPFAALDEGLFGSLPVRHQSRRSPEDQILGLGLACVRLGLHEAARLMMRHLDRPPSRARAASAIVTLSLSPGGGRIRHALSDAAPSAGTMVPFGPRPSAFT